MPHNQVIILACNTPEFNFLFVLFGHILPLYHKTPPHHGFHAANSTVLRLTCAFNVRVMQPKCRIVQAIARTTAAIRVVKNVVLLPVKLDILQTSTGYSTSCGFLGQQVIYVSTDGSSNIDMTTVFTLLPLLCCHNIVIVTIVVPSPSFHHAHSIILTLS